MPDALTGTIFDIRRFSIHDGPGIRTTIFFKGCPLSCLWCHNPESQGRNPEVMLHPNRCIDCGACIDACPQGAITRDPYGVETDPNRCRRCGDCTYTCPSEARELVGKQKTVEQVTAEIERDVPFFEESGGGVTFSGGEPLMQPWFLLDLLTACKEMDVHTAVDTSGYAAWQTIERILPFTDLFLYDIKVMEPTLHQRYTGVSNERILANLAELSRAGANINLRMPVIPGVNDDEENLRRVAELAASLPGMMGLDLLPYHRAAVNKYQNLNMEYQLVELVPPGSERMEEVAEFFRSKGVIVKIGG